MSDVTIARSSVLCPPHQGQIVFALVSTAGPGRCCVSSGRRQIQRTDGQLHVSTRSEESASRHRHDDR